MFVYYLGLGFLHLRRNPVLTALMVLTLGVGVAASMSTLTVLRVMTGDPIPEKSDRLFVPLVDIRPDDGSDPDPEPPYQLSYQDTVALHAAKQAFRQSGMFNVSPAIDPGRPDTPPWFGFGLAVHADWFAMLEIPFVKGGPWTAQDDARAGNVTVLTESAAKKAFGDVDPIGKTIKFDERDMVVTGIVSDDWEPLPRFYRLVAGPGAFGGEEELLMPFATAVDMRMENQGNTSCYSDEGSEIKDWYEAIKKRGTCVWMTLWIELKSPADAAAYKDFLAGYVSEQRKLGRFPRKDNQRLYNVMEWLDANKVVSKDRRIQTYLAFGFLLVCLINTIGLFLAKFSGRSGEIGVRRALGATRKTVFKQYLIEAGVVGIAGGIVGLGLTYGWLWVMGKMSEQTKMVANVDGVMMATTFAVALLAALLAGLFPTWVASRVQPAVQLKSQ